MSYLNNVRVNPEQLITFSVVAEYGSVSKAAEILQLSQPAVSGQLRNLQEQVGQALYQRRARGIQLTDAGEELLPYAHAIARNMHQVTEHVELWQHRVERSLDLGLSYALGTQAIWFMEQARSVRLRINIHAGTASELVKKVQRGELDAAAVIAPVHHAELDQHVIGHDELRLIVPPEYPLQSILATDHIATKEASNQTHQTHRTHNKTHPTDVRVPLDALQNQTLLWASTGSGVKRHAERLLAQAGVAPESGLDLGSLDAVRVALLNGHGVALLPVQYVRYEIDRGLLLALSLDSTQTSISHLLITPPAKMLCSELRLLADLLLAGS